jgi:hypothetical protein
MTDPNKLINWLIVIVFGIVAAYVLLGAMGGIR